SVNSSTRLSRPATALSSLFRLITNYCPVFADLAARCPRRALPPTLLWPCPSTHRGFFPATGIRRSLENHRQTRRPCRPVQGQLRHPADPRSNFPRGPTLRPNRSRARHCPHQKRLRRNSPRGSIV